jgi:photosystem II stability/assembly factor-like uncharacterized protein
MKSLYISFLIFLIPINLFAQWFWQNPIPPLEYNLSTVKIVSNDMIIIGSAEENKIYLSTNRGYSWGPNDFEFFGSIRGINFVNDQKGYLITGSYIYTTDDGGFNWYTQMNPLPGISRYYNSVFFVDSLFGVIVGEVWINNNYPNGLLLKTHDGGNLWTPIYLPTENIFRNCHFFNQNEGIALSSSKIFYTVDGGLNWEEKFYSSYYFLRDMSFADDLNGIVVGGYGNSPYILRTTNGGQTWNQVNISFSTHLWKVKYLDSAHVYATSGNYALIYSEDGGLNWSVPTSYPSNANAKSLDVLSDSLIITAGTKGTIFKSIDGGQNLFPSHYGTTKSIFSVHFINRDYGFASGEAGLIMKTTNSGAEWIENNLSLQANLNGIEMLDEMTAISVTSNGQILKTTDSGNNWQVNPFQVNYSLNNIKMFNQFFGAIVGNNSTFLITTDSGEQWTQIVLPFSSAKLNDLCYLDINKIIIVGDYNIYNTIDGGSSWSETVVDKKLFSISKLDINSAIACGSHNTILKSTDGGQTWFNLPNPYGGETDFIAVSFVNSALGKIAADRGVIYQTSNGGNSWHFDKSINYSILTGDLLKDIFMLDSSSAVTVGNFGLILSTMSDHLLPVEITSFSARLLSGKVFLYWHTASELNNHLFEIERKLVSNSFESEWTLIGFKLGQGTTTEQTEYAYTDEIQGINADLLRYRLKQVDFDGSYYYSQIIEIQIVPLSFSLSQNYPNPFNPSTIISWQSPVGSWQILKIYDVLGNEVAPLVDEYRPAGNYEVEFNASNLPSGIYFYRIEVGNFIETKKMVLLR